MTQLPPATAGLSSPIPSDGEICRWPLLVECARAALGNYPVPAIQTALRFLMLEEALIRGRGNLTTAAKTLGITRQAVQQMIYQFDLRTTVSRLRARPSH